MSPMAVGKPHTRTFSVDSGATVNMPSISFGENRKVEGLKIPSRIMLHHDDLVVPRPNVDIKSPLRTILQQGDLLARQADTHIDFRRPDFALQEYVSALEIAVNIVPRHPDYLALQKDRGELYRLYVGLKKRISSQHEKFAEVKESIKKDNARTGVKPLSKSQATEPAKTPSHESGTQSESKPNAITKPKEQVDSMMAKKKIAPAVQPKPDALHGKAIQPPVVSDLASRFARLQNGGPVQDPRINTRPIDLFNSQASSPISSRMNGNGHAMNRSSGPREISSSPITKPRVSNLPLGIVLEGMPRAPDAIHHSPLRTAGAPDMDTANLPSSVSRNSSFLGKGGKDSAQPISTVGPSPFVADERQEYFTSPTHSSHDNAAPSMPEKKTLPSPDAAAITAEDLVVYLKQGQQSLKVLIVDLRNREEFDNGHILSQSTICVEPITLRQGISGEELSDSMVIAPTSEQDLFQRRQEFDLLVFYDQSSTSIKNSNLGKNNDSVLRDFSLAVYDYGYEKRLKRRPVLLTGGLDAWIDLLGPYALQASTNGDGHPSTPSLRKITASSVSRREALLAAKRKARSSRVGTKKEEDEWDSVMKIERANTHRYGTMNTSTADELSYARTQDEFLRRFPEVPVRESMISTMPSSLAGRLEDSLPRPPARPAPALPRQRSSGITEKGVTLQYAQPAGPTSSNLVVQPGTTGLHNGGNLCYMNAALQLISNSRVLKDMLTNFQPGSLPVPPSKSDKIETPPLQIMTRAIGNLLSHMWSGNYKVLDAMTLRGYISAVDGATSNGQRDRRTAYGATIQHDSNEFTQWLLEILIDELNEHRGSEKRIIPLNESREMGGLEPVVAAKKQWEYALLDNNSPIFKEMGELEQFSMTCGTPSCNTRRTVHRQENCVRLRLKDSTRASATILSLFKDRFGKRDVVEGFKCEVCNKKSEHVQVEWLCRLPNTLWVAIDRGDKYAPITKVKTALTFPERLDLSPFFIATDPITSTDREFRPPFMYDVVSVTMHVGDVMTSGHYINYSRVVSKNQGGKEAWYKFDDSRVEQAPFQSTQGYIGNPETATYLCLQRV